MVLDITKFRNDSLYRNYKIGEYKVILGSVYAIGLGSDYYNHSKKLYYFKTSDYTFKNSLKTNIPMLIGAALFITFNPFEKQTEQIADTIVDYLLKK